MLLFEEREFMYSHRYNVMILAMEWSPLKMYHT